MREERGEPLTVDLRELPVATEPDGLSLWGIEKKAVSSHHYYYYYYDDDDDDVDNDGYADNTDVRSHDEVSNDYDFAGDEDIDDDGNDGVDNDGDDDKDIDDYAWNDVHIDDDYDDDKPTEMTGYGNHFNDFYLDSNDQRSASSFKTMCFCLMTISNTNIPRNMRTDDAYRKEVSQAFRV